MKEQCNEMGVELIKIDLTRKIIRRLREEILNELAEKFPNGKPDKLTIAVTGLEASILTDVNEESPVVLQILNMDREHYVRDLPYPSTFWLPGYAITKIALVAPDFWSWRGGGVDELVSSEEAIRRAITEAIRSREPTNWDEAIYQIILFERLIEGHPGSEDGTDKQKSEYRILQYRLGAAYHFLEKYPRAHQHYRRAREISELSGDFAQQSKELNALGLVCRAMGKLQKSLDYFYEYLDRSEKRGYKKGQAVALGHIGLVYRDMKQNKTAIKHLKRARKINKKIRNRFGESDNLGNLGVAYNSQGKAKEAIDYFQQALELSRKCNDRPSERDMLIKIATYYRERKELNEAQNYYEMAIDTCQEMGDDRNICDLLIYLAELSLEFKGTKKEIDLYENALDLYENALDLSRKLRDEKKKLHCLIKLIQLLHRQWEPDKAKRYIDEARTLLGNNLKLKKINVWLKDGLDRQPERLATDRKYYLCLNIGELDPKYSPLLQTEFIYNLAGEREDSNKPLIGTEKTSRALEEQEQILRPTPETYGVEEGPKVTETLGPKTTSHIETQPTSLTPDQQLRQEPSELIHEELSKGMVEVSVRLNSRAFEFDKSEKQLHVSLEKDFETICFIITPREIGKQSITIEGAANDIPFDDLTIEDIEVEEAVATEVSEIIESVKFKEPVQQPESLQGRDLKRADLRGAKLSEADLSEADLSEADLSGANLSGANLRKTNLFEANLSYAKLRGADLTEAKLVRTDLRWADLRKTKLVNADLYSAELRSANLQKANLSKANLTQAVLFNAILKSAILDGADLFNAGLKSALLESADFRGANMINTNLEYATFNKESNFTGARINLATKKTLPKSSLVAKWDTVVKRYIEDDYYSTGVKVENIPMDECCYH